MFGTNTPILIIEPGPVYAHTVYTAHTVKEIIVYCTYCKVDTVKEIIVYCTYCKADTVKEILHILQLIQEQK